MEFCPDPKFHGIPWNFFHTPEFHGIPWNSMELLIFPQKVPWNSMEFHGIPWNFFWSSMEFHGIPWNLINFIFKKIIFLNIVFGIWLMIRCYLAKISQKRYKLHWFQYRNSYFEHPSVSENGTRSAKMACCSCICNHSLKWIIFYPSWKLCASDLTSFGRPYNICCFCSTVSIELILKFCRFIEQTYFSEYTLIKDCIYKSLECRLICI